MSTLRLGWSFVLQVYWRPGNGASFLDLVQKLTGEPLTGDAWVAALQESTPEKVAAQKKAYEAALKTGPAIPPGAHEAVRIRAQVGGR